MKIPLTLATGLLGLCAGVAIAGTPPQELGFGSYIGGDGDLSVREIAFDHQDNVIVAAYGTFDGGSVTDYLLDVSGQIHAAGQGFWYVVKPAGDCASWQTLLGAQPERDVGLP